MSVSTWIAGQGGIVHRDAVRGRFPATEIRRAVAAEEVRPVRSWLATEIVDPALVTAASLGGRLACVSVARLRRWWVPDAGTDLHVALLPHARRPSAPLAVLHWTRPHAPASLLSPQVSVEDALAHIAGCLPRESAMAIWESAVRVENLSPDALRVVTWRHPAARECAAAVKGLSDSGLETIFVRRLVHWPVRVRQQVVIAGRPVDVVIGERLVAQIDGWAHHSSAAQRVKDIAHDAELRLRGYTVFRFGYAQVLHDWPSVERALARAVAAGLHVAR